MPEIVNSKEMKSMNKKKTKKEQSLKADQIDQVELIANSDQVQIKEDAEQQRKDKKKHKKDKKRKELESEEDPNGSKKAKKGDTGSLVQNQANSASSISEFMAENKVAVTGLDGKPYAVQPIFEFAQAAFPPKLNDALISAFSKPTFIQSVTWPPILKGQDLVGIAATGSGKTLAFGVPSMIHIQNRLSDKSVAGKPLVLVLSPTRELAMQIQEQYETFGKAAGIKSTVIYGGVSKWEQKKALKQGMNVIVATPGRLIDLFEEDASLCDLSEVKYLVLDEADRMLDIGFEEAIKKIVARLPASSVGRQTVMFSATWPQSIQKMAMAYLKAPVKVTIGSTDLSANASIEQRVEVLDPMAKESRLLQLLKDYHKSRTNRILIFALYKKEASRLEMTLKRNGYNVCAIHGDLSQHQRSASIESFRKGSCPLLIATDVAARGIDIPNVEYVINVTFPLTVEDYCHRIGRTGRAGKTGISHTFFTLHDKSHSGGLINVLKQAGQPVPPELMKFGTTVKKKVDPNYGVFAKDVDMTRKGTKITFSDDE